MTSAYNFIRIAWKSRGLDDGNEAGKKKRAGFQQLTGEPELSLDIIYSQATIYRKQVLNATILHNRELPIIIIKAEQIVACIFFSRESLPFRMQNSTREIITVSVDTNQAFLYHLCAEFILHNCIVHAMWAPRRTNPPSFLKWNLIKNEWHLAVIPLQAQNPTTRNGRSECFSQLE